MIEEFEQLVYIQFSMIYSNCMEYDKSKLEVYQKMINNHLKQQSSGGKKIFISRSNSRSNNLDQESKSKTPSKGVRKQDKKPTAVERKIVR